MAWNNEGAWGDILWQMTARCVLIFARPSLQEERLKGLRGAAGLFDWSRRRLIAAAAAAPEIDVVLVGVAEEPLPGAISLAQRGRDFGERFLNAFADVRRLGYTHIVAVPIDVPALGAAQIAAAFEGLRTSDVVLGPSPDGGVYLVGIRRDTEELFRGVPWRTGHVFHALLLNAREAVVLEALRDVDKPADLGLLAADPSIDDELRCLLISIARAERSGPLPPISFVPGARPSSLSAGRSPPAPRLAL